MRLTCWQDAEINTHQANKKELKSTIHSKNIQASKLSTYKWVLNTPNTIIRMLQHLYIYVQDTNYATTTKEEHLSALQRSRRYPPLDGQPPHNAAPYSR